ncbi:MAG TPA: hypothetical protein DEQ09_12930 [Bacteroidales bacterium]|nr:hypothetical protein [Bacteroidales bacterium]
MSTDLEKYLKENRKKLDVETPDDKSIWESIRINIKNDRSIDQQDRGKIILMRLRNIAAIVLIALLAGYVISDIVTDLTLNRRITLARIDGQLGAKEKEYIKLIRYKKQEIGSFEEIDNIIIKELLEEVDNLDTIYNTVMDDMNKNGYNEKMVNTIFDTYEKKIRILELIIMETNKPENNETDKKIAL